MEQMEQMKGCECLAILKWLEICRIIRKFAKISGNIDDLSKNFKTAEHSVVNGTKMIILKSNYDNVRKRLFS